MTDPPILLLCDDAVAWRWLGPGQLLALGGRAIHANQRSNDARCVRGLCCFPGGRRIWDEQDLGEARCRALAQSAHRRPDPACVVFRWRDLACGGSVGAP